jgi:hypothetical protein
MILFAYAGNMNVDEFSETVPSAKRIGVGKLPGYQFAFNTAGADDSAKANVIQSFEPDAAVWGVLIHLDDAEIPSFYNMDAATNDLKLEPMSCMAEDGQLYQAHVFTTKPHAMSPYLLPYDWYQQRILLLAQNAGLPQEYINQIAAMPSKADPDEKRAQRRRKKFGL